MGAFGKEGRFIAANKSTAEGFRFNPSSFSGVGLSRAMVNQSTRFGTSRRFEDAKTTSTAVGPGKYPLTASKNGQRVAWGGGFSKAARFHKKKDLKAPEFVNLDKYSNFSRPGTGSMSKSRRFVQDRPNTASPGPAGYGVATPKRVGSAHMGTAKRFQNGGRTSTPGPGFPSSSHSRPQSQASQFGKSKRFDNSEQKRPSTGNSYLKTQTSLSPSGAIFGSSRRFERPSKYSSVGIKFAPESFSNIGSSRPNINPSGKFGKSKRFIIETESISPGPAVGTETTQSRPTTGKFGGASRWAPASKHTSPGPGQYSINGAAVALNSPGARLGKSERFSKSPTEEEQEPGPSYLPDGIETTGSFPAWKLGNTQKRQTEDPPTPQFIAAPAPLHASAKALFGSSKRF